MKRRLIALVVSLVLVFTMMPMSAMAADPELVTGISGRMRGSDGDYYLQLDVSVAAGVTVESLAVAGFSGDLVDTTWKSDILDTADIIANYRSIRNNSYLVTIVATNAAGDEETYTINIKLDIELSWSKPYFTLAVKTEGAPTREFVPAFVPVVLSLDGAKLEYNDGELVITGVSNTDGTVYTVVNGEKTDNNVDLSSFGIDASKLKIGDKVTVTLKAEHDDAEESPISKQLSYTITLADYMDINGLNGYYILKVEADSGISSVSFNYDHKHGDYFFFDDDDLRITVSVPSYYSVTGISLNNGGKVTSAGNGKYDLKFGDNDSINVLTIKSSKADVGTVAPTYYYTIRAYAGTGGTITPSGSISVANGSNQTFFISASSGYEIESVVVDGVNKGAISAFTFADVCADHSIVASFKKVSSVTTSPSGTIPPTITTPGSIPATGAVTLAIPAAVALLAGLALIPRSKKED